MIKKILFSLFMLVNTIAFSQEKYIYKLSAAPNPFKNSTKITFNSVNNLPVLFTVKNVLGKTVFSEKINTVTGKNSIPFFKGNLATGIYIYTLQNKTQVTSKRFVIQ